MCERKFGKDVFQVQEIIKISKGKQRHKNLTCCQNSVKVPIFYRCEISIMVCFFNMNQRKNYALKQRIERLKIVFFSKVSDVLEIESDMKFIVHCEIYFNNENLLHTSL